MSRNISRPTASDNLHSPYIPQNEADVGCTDRDAGPWAVETQTDGVQPDVASRGLVHDDRHVESLH